MHKNKRISGISGHLSRRRFLQGAAVGISLATLPKFAGAAEEKRLNFYNWDTYIGETTLADFTSATGVDVKMDLFADNDELFAKLRSGNPGYDVIVPSSNWVARMIEAKMLMPLEHDRIPNIRHITPRFLQDTSFDPGRKYSLPYMWGTVGIGYRKSKVNGTPDSWKVLYDSDEYSGRIALLSDPQIMIGLANKYLGGSFNVSDPAEIKRCEELLIKQKPHIKAFAEDNGQDLLAAGDVDLTMEYNGDIAQLMTEDDDIGYIIPNEGGELWQDTLAIPVGAPHPENAHTFINYIYEPEVNAMIADFIQYATPNKTAAESMDESYSQNSAIFPPDDKLAKSESPLYLGEEVISQIEEAATRIFAA